MSGRTTARDSLAAGAVGVKKRHCGFRKTVWGRSTPRTINGLNWEAIAHMKKGIGRLP